MLSSFTYTHAHTHTGARAIRTTPRTSASLFTLSLYSFSIFTCFYLFLFENLTTHSLSQKAWDGRSPTFRLLLRRRLLIPPSRGLLFLSRFFSSLLLLSLLRRRHLWWRRRGGSRDSLFAGVRLRKRRKSRRNQRDSNLPVR